MTDTATTSSPSDRPDRKTRTLPNGDTVHEAGDCQFVSSPSGTVHQRGDCDHDNYDYTYHPKCGQRLADGSLWSRVDAADAEEAVMKYNLIPCTKCIANSYQLERWRKAKHSALVMKSVTLPDRWVDDPNP